MCFAAVNAQAVHSTRVMPCHEGQTAVALLGKIFTARAACETTAKQDECAHVHAVAQRQK